MTEKLPGSESLVWWSPEGRVWTVEHYANMCDWGDRSQRELRVLDQLIGAAPQRILDLPSGFGRHSIALAGRGHTVIGADINSDFLKMGQSAAQGLSDLRGEVHFVQCDMRATGFADDSFDVALNLFTSFGYFETRQEDGRFFGEIARILRPRGRFILDLPNPEVKLASLTPEFGSDYGDGLHVDHQVSYDALEQIIHETRLYNFADGKSQTAEMHTRLYTPEQIVLLGASFGMEFSRLYDKDGRDFTSRSGRYWIELQKS